MSPRSPLSYSHPQPLWRVYAMAGGPALLSAQLVGAGILLAWLFPSIRSPLPDIWHQMTASTAVSVFGVAACLLTCTWRDPRTRSLFWAFFVVTLALIGINVYINLSIPLTSLPNAPGHQWGRPMALQTAFGLSVLSLSALALRQRLSSRFADAALMLGLAYCLLLSNAYIAGAQLMIGQTDLIKTSPHTLAAMWLLWFGAVGQRRHIFPDTTATFARALLPLRTRWENLLHALRRWF